MSDLAATGCGPRFSGGNDNCGWIVILILLLSVCGGSDVLGGKDCGVRGGTDNCGMIVILILLLSVCGDGGFFC